MSSSLHHIKHAGCTLVARWVLTEQYMEVLDSICFQEQCLMHAGSAVLRGVTQDLLQIFEAQVPAQAAERQAPGRQTTSSDPDMPASAGWQGKAASTVVALAEVMFGASASWQGTQQQQQGKPDTSIQLNSSFTATTATTSTTTAGDPSTAHTSTDGKKSPHSPPSSDLADAAAHTDSNFLEPLVVQALDDFSNSGVWSLATHLDLDAAVPGNTPFTPQVHGVNTFTSCITSCRCSRLGPLCAQRLMG